jgi:hypothetical protein
VAGFGDEVIIDVDRTPDHPFQVPLDHGLIAAASNERVHVVQSHLPQFPPDPARSAAACA